MCLHVGSYFIILLKEPTVMKTRPYDFFPFPEDSALQERKRSLRSQEKIAGFPLEEVSSGRSIGPPQQRFQENGGP